MHNNLRRTKQNLRKRSECYDAENFVWCSQDCSWFALDRSRELVLQGNRSIILNQLVEMRFEDDFVGICFCE